MRRAFRPFLDPVHSFHIAVMGIGFTLDTPIRVARYGLGSCVSLVDDLLIEQVRQSYCEQLGEPYEAIAKAEPDGRARRIRAYLDLVQREALAGFEALRRSSWADPQGIRRYFALLPPTSPLHALRAQMLAAPPGPERERHDAALRAALRPGPIEANIMTKLDRAVTMDGQPRPEGESDAVAAMRGFAESELVGGLVLSAGMNVKLFAGLSAYDAFFPVDGVPPRKHLILKVSDYRSAFVQGKLLARRGIWVAEYRIESGLNCGGHAFPTEGLLLGPILEEFMAQRQDLENELFPIYQKALEKRGITPPDTAPPFRVTVQGGIGTAAEDGLLRDHYGADGTGWATPFLTVREVTNVSELTRERLRAVRPEDIRLSWGSPVGVPFWTLANSESELSRQQRVAAGRPGSPCPKHFIALNHEFGELPLCSASRAYQKKKLQQLAVEPGPDHGALCERVEAPQCICHDLGGDIKRLRGIEVDVTPAICPGPSARHFRRDHTLDELVDHIYGRADLLAGEERPHQLITELMLYVDFLADEIERHGTPLGTRAPKSFQRYAANLRSGIAHYRAMADVLGAERDRFLANLAQQEARLLELDVPGASAPASRQVGAAPSAA
jgi:hypothetical protein